jgi:hypothetical protein
VQNKPVLVPAEAEIRMMLVLQKSLNEEREDFFANRPGFGNDVPTDTDKARLERMYHQQGSLAELFDSLSQSIFGPQEHAPSPDEAPPGEDGGAGEGDGGDGGAGAGDDMGPEGDGQDNKEGGR